MPEQETTRKEGERTSERRPIRSEAYMGRLLVQTEDALDPDKTLSEVTANDLTLTREKASVLDEASRRANRTYWKERAKRERGEGSSYTYEEQLAIFDQEWHDFARQHFDNFKKKPPEGGRRGPSFENKGDYFEYKFLRGLGIDLENFDVRKFREERFSNGRDIFGFIDFIKATYPASDEKNVKMFTEGYRALSALQQFGQMFDIERAKDLSEYVFLAYSDPEAYAKKVNAQRGIVKREDERKQLRKLADIKFNKGTVAIPPSVRTSDQSDVVPPENRDDQGLTTSRGKDEDDTLQDASDLQTSSEPTVTEIYRADRPIAEYGLEDLKHDDFGISIAEALLDPKNDAKRVRVAFYHRLREDEDERALRRMIETSIGNALGVRSEISIVNDDRDNKDRRWVFRVDISQKDVDELRLKLDERKRWSEEQQNRVEEKKSIEEVRTEIYKSAEEWTLDELQELAVNAIDILRQEKVDDLGKVRATVQETMDAERQAGRNEIVHAGNIVIIPRSEKEREMIVLEGVYGDIAALNQVIHDTRFIERILDENIPDEQKPILYVGGGLINIGNENIPTLGALLKLKSMKEFSKYIVLSRTETDTVETADREGKRFVPRTTEQLALYGDADIDGIVQNMRDSRAQQLMAKNPLIMSAIRELIQSVYKTRNMRNIEASIDSIPGLTNDSDRAIFEKSLRLALLDVLRGEGPKLPVKDAIGQLLSELPQFTFVENGLTALSRYSQGQMSLDELAGLTDDRIREDFKDVSDPDASEEDIMKFIEGVGGAVAVVPVTVGRNDATNPADRKNTSGRKVWRLLSSGGAVFGEGQGREKQVVWENTASGVARREHRPQYAVIGLDQNIDVLKPGEHIRPVAFPQLQQAA